MLCLRASYCDITKDALKNTKIMYFWKFFYFFTSSVAMLKHFNIATELDL